MLFKQQNYARIRVDLLIKKYKNKYKIITTTKQNSKHIIRGQDSPLEQHFDKTCSLTRTRHLRTQYNIIRSVYVFSLIEIKDNRRTEDRYFQLSRFQSAEVVE